DDKVTESNEGYNITYILTDQGYDFLFRTKEVDQEINFSVEEFRLRELIKRKNYKKALQQSISLIQMLRQKKKDIQQFMLKIKENIHEVDIGRFEDLVNSTYDLLDEEYQALSEIMNMVRLSEQRLHEEFQLTGKLGEDLKRAQREISQIRDNLAITLSEQKDLILSRQSLSKIYIETIKETFSFSLEKRYDLEEEILRKLEKCVETEVSQLWQMLNSLFLPSAFKHLNVGLLYEPQGMLKLDDKEQDSFIEQEEMAEDSEKIRVEKLNGAYVGIMKSLIIYALNNGGRVSFSNYIGYLKEEPEVFDNYSEDRLIFTTMLKLYDIGVIDIEKWKTEQEDVIMNITEEFNLEYCLSKIQEEDRELLLISSISVIKEDDSTFEIYTKSNHEEMTMKVEISDFTIKVDKKDGTY
ncbi:MAG TPA: hypothetical protein VEF53_08470, partial [Patescibacteria group bacterium]|nr:hypothetical protein [Patescibacteria group bacterium]